MTEWPSGDGNQHDRSFLPDDWKTLAPLVDQVLDAPPDQRNAVLDAVSGGDPARRAVIAKLVEECERDTPVLERPAAERFARLLASDDEIAMPGMLGGRYRIEREIGRGGMARVYLAHDVKHARDVAVKVIRPEFAASLGRDRFLREIAIAARLRHPNIVPVYDSGDADGLLYFVMPHEDGRSLRERIGQAHPLTVSERLSILRDVARALSYAHEHGVVHRDIKPDNVMLSGGAAVVTDFGIAKAVSAAQADGSATITQTGAGIGTPSYMAPEQAIGDPSTDHRADIYSFGCLAYELFAGTPPFHGGPSHEVIAAHMTKVPVPLSNSSPDAPNAVAELVGRCLAKSPNDRPQSANEVLVALESITPQTATPIGFRSVTTTPAASAQIARRTLGTTRAIKGVGAALLVLAAGVFALNRSRAATVADPPGEPTIAVLPFSSLNGDTLRRDVVTGFSDDLNNSLFELGLLPVGRNTVNKYRDESIVPSKVGLELDARFLLTGIVAWLTDGFTLRIELRQAADDAVWLTQRFSGRELNAKLREEIVKAIADSLRRRGVLAEAQVPTRGRDARAPNAMADISHYAGRTYLRRRGTSVSAAVDNFRSAAKLDSLFPRAYSGLSIALALTPYFEARTTAPRDVEKPATAAAERAAKLDSTLGEPHVALGLVAQHKYDWTTAQREYKRAIELGDDGDPEARIQYGRYLVFRGRFDEGLREFHEAYKTEKGFAVVKSWIAYSHYLKGQQDSALAWSDSAYSTDSTNLTTRIFASLIHLRADDRARAGQMARSVDAVSASLIYVLSAVGDTTAVRSRMSGITRAGFRGPLAGTMEAFVALGRADTATALAALERATDDKEMWPSLQSVCDPLYDLVRPTERFNKLLQRVNLSELAAPNACRASPDRNSTSRTGR